MYTVTFPAYQALFMFLPSRMVSRHRSIPPLQQKHIPSDESIRKTVVRRRGWVPTTRTNIVFCSYLSCVTHPVGHLCVCVKKRACASQSTPSPSFQHISTKRKSQPFRMGERREILHVVFTTPLHLPLVLFVGVSKGARC